MASELTKRAHDSWTSEGPEPVTLSLPSPPLAPEPSGLLDEPRDPFSAPRKIPDRPRLTLTEAIDLLQVETSRRQLAEQGLREIEERFRQMSQYLGKFVWLSDAETKELIYVSPGYERVWYRYREASYALPQDWLNATPPGSDNRLQAQPGSEVRENADKADYQIAGPDGSLRWIRDRMLPIRDDTGQTLYTLGIAEDITEIKTLQEACRKTELTNRALLNIVPDMVFRLNRKGTIREFKPAKDSPVLTPSIDLVGRNLNDLLPNQVAEQAMHYLELTLNTGHVQTFTCQYLLPDYLRDFEARSMVCGEDEVLAIVRDVTERKRLEKEILEISSREQQRIGQDLHDGLGQHLTGITFLSKALEKRLLAKSMEEAEEAAEIGRLVMQALSQTRNLARGLFPIELEQNGLVSALQTLVSNVERLFRIQCRLESDGKVQIMNNMIATHLFRIVQEAVNNSVKHGKAQHVGVSLAAEGDKVVLQIKDDGVGCTPGTRNEGLGLKIMQYRARRIGGVFDLQRGPTGGTMVTVSFKNQS
jgi:PAS domain S-box-containing protein